MPGAILGVAPFLTRLSAGLVSRLVPQRKSRRDDGNPSCTGKRRYRSQGDALEAAAIVGVERQRVAYRCPLCTFWHLATTRNLRRDDWRRGR